MTCFRKQRDMTNRISTVALGSPDASKLLSLSATEFENLVFDLVKSEGLRNCVWRTPGRDGGRDIQGDWIFDDFSSRTRNESWYVECKRYTASISWPVVWEKLAFAQSNCADVLLVITNSSLSPQAVDELEKWNRSKNRPTLRAWGGHDLMHKLAEYPYLCVKYGISKSPIADAALAILSLTQVLVKYANSSETSRAFGADSTQIDVALHAIAELISARLQDITIQSKPSVAIFRESTDGFSWLIMSSALEAARIDRYASRALLSMIYAHMKRSITLSASEHGVEAAFLISIPQALFNDLTVVASWGSLVLKRDAEGKKVTLESQR